MQTDDEIKAAHEDDLSLQKGEDLPQEIDQDITYTKQEVENYAIKSGITYNEAVQALRNMHGDIVIK